MTGLRAWPKRMARARDPAGCVSSSAVATSFGAVDRAGWAGLCRPASAPGASDIQDIHLAIAGLDPAREVVFAEVRSESGYFWRFEEKPSVWRAEFKRVKGARTADVFIEPGGSRARSRCTCWCATTTGRRRRPTCAADRRAKAACARGDARRPLDRAGPAGPDGLRAVGGLRWLPGRPDTSQPNFDEVEAECDSHQRARRCQVGIGHRTPSCSRLPSFCSTPRTRRRATFSSSRLATWRDSGSR